MLTNEESLSISREDIFKATRWLPRGNRFHQEGFSTTGEDKRETEFKEGINEKKEDKDHFIGSQGMIVSEVDIDGKTYENNGSGMLFMEVQNIESKPQFVLTCGHNFICKYHVEKPAVEAQISNFYFRMSKFKDGMQNNEKTLLADATTELKWYVYEKYAKDPSSDDSYFNDIAIAICKTDLADYIKKKNIYIMSLEEADAKKGETICVAGYPFSDDKKLEHENNLLKYMEGTIKEIVPHNKGEEAAILYDKLDTSEGQSGSPVYLKQDDGTWCIIGVHVAEFTDRNGKLIHNIAAGITKSKKNGL